MDRKTYLERRIVISDPARYLCRQVERIADSLEIIASLERQRSIMTSDVVEAVENVSKKLEEAKELLEKLVESMDSKKDEGKKKTKRRRRDPPPPRHRQIEDLTKHAETDAEAEDSKKYR